MKLNKYVFFIDRTNSLLLLSVDNMRYYALEGFSREIVLTLSRLGKCNKQILFSEMLKSNRSTEMVCEKHMLDAYEQLVKLGIIKE